MNIKTATLSNGVMLEYAEQGNATGAAVIFLHGYTDSRRSFDLLLPHLPESIHAFALSQRGHGNSDRPPHGYSPAHFATDVALFMEQVGLDTTIIAGHSMGGIVTQRFALDHPEKTRAVILISSFATLKNNENAAQVITAVESFGESVDRAFVDEFQRSTITLPLDEAFIQTVIDESMKVPSRVWKSVMLDFMNEDYLEELKSLRKPVLLVWGDRDLYVTIGDQNRLLESIAGSQLITYTSTGHAIQWEQPGRFARDAAAFVKKVAG